MKFASDTTYILDGSLETELHLRGVATNTPLWSAMAMFDFATHIKATHQSYIVAGADIITTNTFYTHRRSLAKISFDKETKYINELATELAVQAREETPAERPIFIAGAMTTLETADRLDLIPDADTLYQEHLEQAKILANTAIDFFLLKGFTTIREAEAAAKATITAGKPFMVSFIVNEHKELPSGETLEQAITTINALQPLAYCVNCVLPSIATNNVRTLRGLTEAPIGVYANCTAWRGFDEPKSATTQECIADYLHYCAQWKEFGANIIGGCCGTTTEYTKGYSALR